MDPHDSAANITLQDLAAAAAAAGITEAEAAANLTTTLAAAEDLSVAPEVEAAVTKAGQPQRYVLGVAYQAGPDPRITKGADGGRDYFTEAELEKAAWSFLADGPPEVGIGHVDGTVGAATVVESYVYRGPPWDLGDGIVVKSGDWLIGAICDEPAWQLVKAGKLNGFSPQGTATRRRLRRAV